MPTIPSFALSATLTPSAPVPGGTLTATLTLNNSAGATITNPILTVSLPAGVISAVTTSQGTFTVSGSTLALVLGTIAAGATLTVTATVESQAPGAATVSASLASDQGTAGPATATVTVATRRPTASGLRRLGSRPSELPPGVYSLKKLTDSLDISTLPPGVVGIFLQTRWDRIEATQGVYDFSGIDAIVDQATDLGLVVELSLGMGGGQTPAWVLPLCGSTFTYINPSVFQTTLGQSLTVPIPWDGAGLALKTNLIKQAGIHFANSATVRAVEVNGIACGLAGDWFLPSKQGNILDGNGNVIATVDQVADWHAAGYTTDLAFKAARTMLDAAAYWFPGRVLKQPISTADPDLDTAPLLDLRAFTLGDQVITYGYGRWPNHFMPNRERLKATTLAPTDPAVTGAGLDTSNYLYTMLAAHPKHFTFQAASAASNGASDGYRMNGGTPGDVTAIFQAAMNQAIAYKARVVELWVQDATDPLFADIIAATTDALRTIHAGN